jgi:hypothetical protein
MESRHSVMGFKDISPVNQNILQANMQREDTRHFPTSGKEETVLWSYMAFHVSLSGTQ